MGTDQTAAYCPGTLSNVDSGVFRAILEEFVMIQFAFVCAGGSSRILTCHEMSRNVKKITRNPQWRIRSVGTDQTSADCPGTLSNVDSGASRAILEEYVMTQFAHRAKFRLILCDKVYSCQTSTPLGVGGCPEK